MNIFASTDAYTRNWVRCFGGFAANKLSGLFSDDNFYVPCDQISYSQQTTPAPPDATPEPTYATRDPTASSILECFIKIGAQSGEKNYCSGAYTYESSSVTDPDECARACLNKVGCENFIMYVGKRDGKMCGLSTTCSSPTHRYYKSRSKYIDGYMKKSTNECQASTPVTLEPEPESEPEPEPELELEPEPEPKPEPEPAPADATPEPAP